MESAVANLPHFFFACGKKSDCPVFFSVKYGKIFCRVKAGNAV
jgi:hypothetical protein